MSTPDQSDINDVKDELAFSRSVYPELCANWYRKSLKTEVKSSMKFQVTTGNECTIMESKYVNSKIDFEKLELWRKVAVPYEEKNEQLKQTVQQVSQAMDVLSRIKVCQITR